MGCSAEADRLVRGAASTRKAPRVTLAALRRDVSALRDTERARFLQGFFRTGVGEYGEGDRFTGLTVPVSRMIARAYRKLPLRDLATLLASPFHEHRLIALLILVDRHTLSRSAEEKGELHRFYLAHMDGVNSWDLVDTSARVLVGEHLDGDGEPAVGLATAANIWERRVAIVSTFAELRKGRTGLTFRIAELLLDDRHDLIHKAVGWLLREAGKVSERELLAFLRTHYSRLPRTTLRYAIERLSPAERKAWIGGPQ